MWRGFAYTALCVLSAGCTMVVYQTDDFPYRLRRGCGSADDCDRLVTEAKARVAKCGPGSSERVQCPDANADLAVANDLARAKRADARDKPREHGANEPSDERPKRDEHDVSTQQQAETQQNRDDAAARAREDAAARAREDAAARAREDEARRQQQAAASREEQAATKQAQQSAQQSALKQNVQDAAKRAEQAEAERKAREANEVNRQQQREHEQKKSP